MRKTTPRATVRSLLTTQRLAVLCTGGERGPYASLVAFAATRDMRRIFFATPRATRKYDNLKQDPRVSLLMDSRSNRETDFRLAAAATASGVAGEARGKERESALRLFLRKHPSLREFLTSPDCALFGVDVARYGVVDRFQRVAEVRIQG